MTGALPWISLAGGAECPADCCRQCSAGMGNLVHCMGAVPLSFLAFALPGAGRWWLLARLAIAGFLGLNACAIVACNWIKYPEAGRDSGLLGLWMLAVMFGALTFLICTGITLFLLKGSPRG